MTIEEYKNLKFECYEIAKIVTEEDAWNHLFESDYFKDEISKIQDYMDSYEEAFTRVKKVFQVSSIDDFAGYFLRTDGLIEINLID